MIRETQIPWMKEFLFDLCPSPAERGEVAEIIDTFRKLWHVAKAAELNPYPRSPRLTEALAVVRPQHTLRERKDRES